MIIALLALAFAMIVGGLLTAFLGWDIVLVERGWTMVIAGSISAASGALLLGITAAISKLASIQAELAGLRGSLDAEAFGTARSPSTDLSPAALAGGLLGGAALGADDKKQDEDLPQLPLFDDEDRDQRAADAHEPSNRVETARSEESVIPFARRPAPEIGPARDEDMPDIKVPEFLLADRRDADDEDRIADADESLYAAEPDVKDRSQEPAATANQDELVTPAVWPDAATERDVDDEPVEEEAAPEERRPATIIGTYNSGDNKYVMFSDGSIEAQTPGGVFRFKSLDELKEFIASGGEGGSAAAI